ncbi:DUF397 domain-containing protein [Fodinicola acaciae]|uniref:DUF397 domain-containing protein n=1 Tax=Fodinicola acaciae TaxID=2681555 RepID=UPI0013D662E9|nr:DUF397 domain-containing protein [Fodinicola acaciae]
MTSTDFARTPWRISSRSGSSGNCVEVAGVAYAVGVRDTKDRDGGTLVFSAGSWTRFLRWSAV